MLTREFINGQWVTVDANFAQHGGPQASTQAWWNLMQKPRYGQVIGAQSLEDAARAVSSAGYATDPAYAQKLLGITPRTPEQQAFLQQRESEAIAAGAPPHLAQLAARQAALESRWGEAAPGGNFYGIKQTGAATESPLVPQETAMDPYEAQVDALRQQAMQVPQPQGVPLARPQEQPQAPGFWDGLQADPLFNIGLGILSAPGYGGNWLRGAAVGVQNGLAAVREREKFQLEMEATKQKLDERKQRDRLAKIYEERGDLMKAGAIRAGAPLDDLMASGLGTAIGKVSPGDFTPESVQKFAKTGQYSDLVPVPKAPLVQIGGSGQQAPGQPVFGAVQPGYQRTIDPVTGQPKDSPIPGSSASEPTGQERTARSYADRMTAAADQLDALESQGVQGGFGSQVAGAIASEVPYGTAVVSGDLQQYTAAQREFVRAKLRKESGAVIGEKEMSDEVATYFPVPGDDRKVIEQKRQMRRRAIETMRQEAGKADVRPGTAATPPPSIQGVPLARPQGTPLPGAPQAQQTVDDEELKALEEEWNNR